MVHMGPAVGKCVWLVNRAYGYVYEDWVRRDSVGRGGGRRKTGDGGGGEAEILINKSLFYLLSVHIVVILDNNNNTHTHNLLY